MSSVLELDDPVSARETVDVATCDLCGHPGQRVLAEPSPSRCRIVMCEHCGLFYAAPSLPPAHLDKFYDEEFEGDAGTKRRLQNGDIEPRKVATEDRIARDWAMPLIESYTDVAGKTVLDIRCRSGSLAEALSEAGAEVTAIDPLEPNADFAKRRNTIADVRFVPIQDFERLAMFSSGEFDVITALSIHLLSHSPSPRKLVARLFELLKPGGYLFIDEKDVFHPVRASGETVFDTGPAHFFHFTTQTMRQYFEAAGFEIVACELDPVRKKSSRHIRTVVRKPDSGEAQVRMPDACDADAVIAGLRDAERRLQRKSGFNKFMRNARRTARRIINQGGT